jgi:hypothetical protein
LSMLPTTCCRHWLTVHNGLAELKGTIPAGILITSVRRAEATTM